MPYCKNIRFPKVKGEQKQVYYVFNILAEQAVTLNSATAGLEIIFKVLGIGRNDEVITTHAIRTRLIRFSGK